MSAPARKAAPQTTGRIPAATIRAVRRFHALDQEGLASAFQLSVRTIIRWEQRGVHPDLIPEDRTAQAGPKWRKVLLLWMLARYERAGSPDNRQQHGGPDVPPSSGHG